MIISFHFIQVYLYKAVYYAVQLTDTLLKTGGFDYKGENLMREV